MGDWWKDQAPGEEMLAGALSGDLGDESDKFPKRLDRYGNARKLATLILAYIESLPYLSEERAALRDCGNYLLFRDYYTVGKIRLAAMRSCKKHLLCPLCAIMRGNKAMRSYLDRLRAIVAQRPDLTAYMVSFAVVNGPDLAERMRHLQRSQRRLHKRRMRFLRGERGAPYTEAAKAEAAVWTYEVTNKGKGWHPHVHAIWLCTERPDQYRLREEWEPITGDSWTVDVSRYEDQPIEDMFCEVFKYAVKFGSLSMEHLVEAYHVLRGKRLIGSFGEFRKVKVPEELTDELLDDLPYIERLYHFLAGSGVYSVAAVGTVEDPIIFSPAMPCGE